MASSAARSLPDEIWLPVLGWEDYYDVSDQGRIRRVRFGRNGQGISCRVLVLTINRVGYHIINLHRPGVRRTCQVARLVAAAFLGPPPTLEHEVNHKDTNKSNNCPSNLEWCTHAENLRHGWRLGLFCPPDNHGERHGMAKLSEVAARAIRSSREKASVLAARYDVSAGTVAAIRQGRRWHYLEAESG